jgi:transposase
MRQVHLAGDKLFVDYAGMRPKLFDPETGEIIEVELFVAVLGASNYTYAEATRTQQVIDFVSSVSRTFAFIGGVTRAVVPDQLKSAVTTACRYDPAIQRTTAELGRHYATTILPARPRSPRDKAKVEVGVQIAERWLREHGRAQFAAERAHRGPQRPHDARVQGEPARAVREAR